MPLDALFTLADVRRIVQERNLLDLDFFPDRPTTPDNLFVDGLKLGFRIQWSKVDEVDGYRIAVMDDNNLESPRVIIEVPGENTLERDYFVGDNAIQQFFAVQSYKGDLSSDFTAIQSATAVIDGGAADGAPPQPPSSLPEPDTSEQPGWGKKQTF